MDPIAQLPALTPWLAGAAAAPGGSPRRGDADDWRSRSSSRAWRFLCLAEIGNFATLRRHLGRARAERLIIDVAARIGQVLPEARLSVISRTVVELAFEADDRAVLTSAVARLEAAFASPAEFEHESYRVEMVFGVAAALALGCDEVRLAEEAEEALAVARAEHSSQLRDPTRTASTLSRSSLIGELPNAIATDQLFLQFQPKLNLRRREIVGVEALVRWDHPVRGLTLPSDFIPSAESSRHMIPLTLWTLRQGISDQRRLTEHGHHIPVFLNISGHLLGSDAFVTAACDLVGKSNAQIGFEITETAVIRDPDAAITNLQRFADIGVQIAIDDYGAGLSSLAYLKRLPARELKIDKLFVTHLTSSHRDPLIVRSTIDLAHALEMEVTAEGVETPEALALLTVMGCDMAQGFLISRPLGLGAVLLYLDEGKHLDVTSDPRATPGALAEVWQRA